MNREILFKAKRKDTKEWVYGQLIYKNCLRDNGMVEHLYRDWTETCAYIYEDNCENNIEEYPTKFVEVIPETVCQYTGLNDETGKKIFENDIVFYSDFASVYKNDITGIVKYTQNCMFEIEYADKYIKGGKTTRPLVCHEHSIFTQKKTKVIGNIFDEGELI